MEKNYQLLPAVFIQSETVKCWLCPRLINFVAHFNPLKHEVQPDT